MRVDEIFDRSAAHWDDWVRKAIPCYDEVFSTAVELIPYKEDAEVQVLDLGAGTGLFSWHVFQSYPKARFVLFDVASQMLAVGRNRFKGSNQFTFSEADYLGVNESEAYDLIISSLSIHHLLDEQKKTLFRSVYRALKSSSAFINIDQIKGETKNLRALYWEKWLKRVREAGAEEEEIEESIRRRCELDRDATLAEQLGWLKEAGFQDVDCVYRNYFIGVFFALKE